MDFIRGIGAYVLLFAIWTPVFWAYSVPHQNTGLTILAYVFSFVATMVLVFNKK